MTPCLCGCNQPARIRGQFASFACEKRYKPPKEKKPRSTGSRARKARIRNMVKDYTEADWQKALDYFDHSCAYCNEKRDDLQQEHFVPVKDGGNYVPTNIIPACPPCNSEKQGRDPFKWLVVEKRRLREYLKIEEYFSGLAQNVTSDSQTPLGAI
jgi:5-methylcytosine-specific restriction endonuclease McrA